MRARRGGVLLLGLGLGLGLGGCDLGLGRRVAVAERPVVAIAAGALFRLTSADRDLLERYVRSSLRWSLSLERGQRYATRRILSDGQWVDGSNGFHSAFGGAALGAGVHQVRVMIGLDGEHGFGNERGVVTRSPAAVAEVALRLTRDGDQPGLVSYLILETTVGLRLEVFEQSESRSREFTQQAIRDVAAEVSAVLASRAELEQSGLASRVAPAGSARKVEGPTTLLVEDGMQGGMFTVSSWLNPGEPGTCFMRVFFTGEPRADDLVPDELRGKREVALSVERVEPSSAQLVGWGTDASLRFYYRAHLTVYEGDWQHRYPARFELWFRGAKGERKLAETTRRIAGWQR